MSTVKGYAFALPFSWAAASQAWPASCSTCTLCKSSNSRRISGQDFGLEVRVCAQAVHFSLPGNSCACTEAVGCTGPRPLCLLVARPGLGIMQGGLLRWPTLGPKPWSWPWLWPWSCRGCCWPPTRLLSCMRLRLQTALAFASPAFSTLQRAAISVTLHPVQACPASSSCCASRVRLLRWRSASFLRSARSSSEACQPRMCLLPAACVSPYIWPPHPRLLVFSSGLAFWLAGSHLRLPSSELRPGEKKRIAVHSVRRGSLTATGSFGFQLLQPLRLGLRAKESLPAELLACIWHAFAAALAARAAAFAICAGRPSLALASSAAACASAGSAPQWPSVPYAVPQRGGSGGARISYTRTHGRLAGGASVPPCCSTGVPPGRHARGAVAHAI